jgi:hypothetical protein
MYDFLTFKTFIAPAVLLVCYYLGAVVMPLASIYMVRKLAPYFGQAARKAAAHIPEKYRNRLYFSMFVAFICMEIIWRMMFEAMIAYFQMREALVGLAG